jgi:hypothetical protein
MVRRESFGRRGTPQPVMRRVAASVAPVVVPDPVPAGDLTSSQMPSLDDELQAWKAERRRGNRHIKVPLRSFLLMAGLCFGLGSLVLPDSVSDTVNWVLYAASAVSFVLGFRARRQKQAAA